MSATTRVPSEKTTSRHGRRWISPVTPRTCTGAPVGSNTQSPARISPIVVQPSGVGTSVSRARAFPSIRATRSSGSSTHSSVRPRQNSCGWITNGSSLPTSTSSVRFSGGAARSIAETRWLWNTRNEAPSRRSTLAGWTMRASQGSTLTRPCSTSRRIVPSERTDVAMVGVNHSARTPGAVLLELPLALARPCGRDAHARRRQRRRVAVRAAARGARERAERMVAPLRAAVAAVLRRVVGLVDRPPDQPAERQQRHLQSFFFNETPTTEIYPLSLHDALPISRAGTASRTCARTDARQSRRSSRPFQLGRSEEHTSELQSHSDLVCRLLLE